MKVSIKVTKVIVSVWKKEITNIADCTVKTKLTYKTIVRAINTRHCTRNTMDKINAYILTERERKSKLNKLILK